MRMVRWMCNVKVKDRVPSKELREKLATDAELDDVFGIIDSLYLSCIFTSTVCCS